MLMRHNLEQCKGGLSSRCSLRSGSPDGEVGVARPECSAEPGEKVLSP